jgi:leucyl aminopeptidase
MDIQAAISSPVETPTDCLILPVWEEEPFPVAVQQVDQKLGGVLHQLKTATDIKGKPNELTPILNCPGLAARRVLLLGLGKKDKADLRSLYLAASCAARSVTNNARESIALVLPERFGGFSWEDLTQALATGLACGSEGSGIRKSKAERFAPARIHIVGLSPADLPAVQEGVRRSTALARAISLTRELVNTPPCDLYPESFALRAKQVAESASFECVIWDEKKLADEKMGSLLGVAQGSDRPPRLVLLRYRGSTASKTLGLVGKGVTFDSGGLSLKPTDGMLDMKCDMAGAATVLGAMAALAELKLPVNVFGVLALVENMPSGKALRLGDVLTARNGKTIEIHNTDAEGRLILADALAYAVEQKVDHLVDLATLTGACMVALGTEVVGLMANDDSWSRSVQQAAKNAGELVWPLPMFPLYGEMIKSHVADMKNTGGSKWAGAISAAKLLEEFVGTVPWVHLDIAGPAWKDAPTATMEAGGTGAMVKTLVELARMYGEN